MPIAIDYGRLISRTWEVFSRNRVLWLLGMIAAFGAASGNFNFNSGTSGQTNPYSGGDMQELVARLLPLFGLVICDGLILALVLSFVRAAGEAGLIASTDQIERSGQQPMFGQAFALGMG